MVRRKKNGGCLMSVIIFSFYIVGIRILINIAGVLLGAFIIIGAIYLIFLLIRWIIGLRSPFSGINFDTMNGHDSEYFRTKILKYNGFSNVKVIQGSEGHGIDILAKKNGMKYAIQCKRYSGNVGNKAIQEAYSGRTIYGANITVVTTNGYFTEQAKSDARIPEVELWDRNNLQKLMLFSDKKKIENSTNYTKKYNVANSDLHKNEVGNYPDVESKAKKCSNDFARILVEVISQKRIVRKIQG